MSAGSNAKVVIFVVILATLAGAGLVVCIVVLPPAIQYYRELERREQCNRNLRKIGEALHNYGTSSRVFPRSVLPESPTVSETWLTYDDTFSGYFVSNKFEPNAAESFVAIRDQSQFDKVFGVAMVMQDKSHRLPANAFESNMVLAVVKRGKATWQFRCEGVVLKDGLLTLRYLATSKKNDSAEFASPLIVLIRKAECVAIDFVENGNVVKRIGEKAGKSSE
jgi:hypothetical protein